MFRKITVIIREIRKHVEGWDKSFTYDDGTYPFCEEQFLRCWYTMFSDPKRVGTDDIPFVWDTKPSRKTAHFGRVIPCHISLSVLPMASTVNQHHPSQENNAMGENEGNHCSVSDQFWYQLFRHDPGCLTQMKKKATFPCGYVWILNRILDFCQSNQMVLQTDWRICHTRQLWQELCVGLKSFFDNFSVFDRLVKKMKDEKKKLTQNPVSTGSFADLERLANPQAYRFFPRDEETVTRIDNAVRNQKNVFVDDDTDSSKRSSGMDMYSSLLVSLCYGITPFTLGLLPQIRKEYNTYRTILYTQSVSEGKSVRSMHQDKYMSDLARNLQKNALDLNV